MKGWMQGIFGEDSLIGRVTSRIWILFGANLLFVLFSLPIVTAGPAFVAMYHVCLKTLRWDNALNPFREFWKGFVSNFKQALIIWLGALAAFAVLILDISFTVQTEEMVRIFRYPLYLLAGFFLMLLFHFFPVCAAFSDNLKGLLRNALFFAAKNPVRALLVLFLNAGPMIWTYRDLVRIPLYAFVWACIGFSGIAMICSRLLLKDFSIYLPDVSVPDETGENV